MRLLVPKFFAGAFSLPYRRFAIHRASLALASLLLAACKEDKPATSSAAPRPAPSPATNIARIDESREIPRAEHGNPQPKLPALPLWIGTNELKTEIAHTWPQIMTGMMWRTNIEEMEGMLFVMPGEPNKVGFWMRNTLLPLSCAYIDPEGTILELHNMQPRDETPIPSETDRVKYILEVKQGWFDRHNVKPGMLVATDRGTLPKTFSQRN
ncbi:MAG TPA: DUF192 domain-containing protein [Verrucomicrobiae bacterium]|nr:DUF192 domain-containing protein [Verrucomicrobiae bacterium]